MTHALAALSLPIAHLGDGHHMDSGDGWWILMIAGMAVLWIAVAAAVIWLVRGGSINRAHEPPRLSALDVLERRLAEGDITIEEYRERRTVLTQQDGPQTPGAK